VGFTNTSSGNLVLVAGAGSVWTNQSFLHVGHNSWNNWLVISNGGAVYDLDGVVGFAPTSSNNTALVTGVGSVWNSQTFLDVGEGGSSNLLNIAGGSVMSTDVVVGFNAFATNNVLLVSGGSLVVTNSLGKGSLVISRIGGKGSLILNSGSVTADALVATNGANSVVTFNGGTLNSGSTFVTNGQVFAVGDGTHAARFTLLGGMHSFANNLEIRTNAVLSGCGTIDGNVLVDTSGFLFASCGSALNFSGGTLTNNGTITAINGTAVNFFGPVVNNGLIDNTSGNVRFFSTLSGSGSMLTPSTNSWIGGNGKWETATNWSAAQPPSLTDGADFIANAGNKTVTIDATTSGGFPNSLTISNLTVAAPLNSTNTLLLSNAGTNTPLAVRNTFSIGSRGSVFITNSALKVAGPTGGSVTVDGQLTLVDDGTILVSSNLLVGPVNPLGTVNILGGALYVTNAAHNAVTEVRYGTIMLTNAVFATDSLLITNPGASFLNNGGTFTITGLSQVDQGTQTVASGTTQISSNLLIGSAADSTGTVNVAGGQLIATNASITVGSLGVGNMTVSNASVSTIALAVGAGTNSQGTLTLQDGSDVTISSNLTAGSASGATGIVNITGGSLTVTNGTLGVGNDGTVSSGSGTGFMTVSNATVTASTILLGSSAGGQGEMTLDDGGVIQGSGTNAVLICNGFGQIGGDLSWTNIGSAIYCGYTHPGVYALSNGTSSCQDMFVGYDNTGTMTVAGGTMNILSRLIVGQLSNPISSGAVWITGGQLTIASFSIIGNSGIGQMTISNGIVTMTDVFVGNGSNPGTLTLAGGALMANGIVLANPNSRFNFTGGRLSAKAITNTNGRVVTLGDGISPATFNLLGGASSLDNGLTVAAASTLSGLGTVSGTVVNFGFIFPLSGALTISGVVTNHGTIAPTAGNAINFNGQVFNDGFIFTNRATHFNGGLINSGTLVDADADPDHDGFTNLEEYEAGTDPNDPKSTPFQITSIVQQGNDVLLTWLTAGGKTNVVQATGNAPSNYSNNFTDLSPVIVPQGSDLTYTNYLDLGAATNFPARYYRVRLVP
jgi:T5SS/PEP-CTERM-associated repeat protein